MRLVINKQLHRSANYCNLVPRNYGILIIISVTLSVIRQILKYGGSKRIYCAILQSMHSSNNPHHRMNIYWPRFTCMIVFMRTIHDVCNIFQHMTKMMIDKPHLLLFGNYHVYAVLSVVPYDFISQVTSKDVTIVSTAACLYSTQTNRNLHIYIFT